MTEQIKAFSRNRFDQSSAQDEFCTDNTLHLNVFLRIFVDYE